MAGEPRRPPSAVARGEQTSRGVPSHCSEVQPGLPGVGAAEGGDSAVSGTRAHTAREVTFYRVRLGRNTRLPTAETEPPPHPPTPLLD